MNPINFQNKFKIFVDPADAIVSSQIIKGRRNTKEINLISQLIKKGDIVLDLGAHIGYFSLHLSQMVEDNGKVYAFEPSINNYSFLVKNIQVNNYKNIIPFNKAVADKPGKGTLFLAPIIKGNKSNTGDHRIYDIQNREQQEIDITTLDDFIKEYPQKISFIKIDTQGSEYKIFKGATTVLKEMKPILFFEFWPSGLKANGSDANAMLQFLYDLEYECFLEKTKIYPNHIFDKNFNFINLFGFPKQK